MSTAVAETVVRILLYTPGCASDSSDLDVLCVGSGSKSADRSIDVVWATRSRLESQNWLGSELAGHVAKYGQVLAGQADWMGSTFVAEAAIVRKIHAVVTRSKVLSAFEDQLGSPRKRKYTVRIRRTSSVSGCCLLEKLFRPAPSWTGSGTRADARATFSWQP